MKTRWKKTTRPTLTHPQTPKKLKRIAKTTFFKDQIIWVCYLISFETTIYQPRGEEREETAIVNDRANHSRHELEVNQSVVGTTKAETDTLINDLIMIMWLEWRFSLIFIPEDWKGSLGNLATLQDLLLKIPARTSQLKRIPKEWTLQLKLKIQTFFKGNQKTNSHDLITHNHAPPQANQGDVSCPPPPALQVQKYQSEFHVGKFPRWKIDINMESTYIRRASEKSCPHCSGPDRYLFSGRESSSTRWKFSEGMIPGNCLEVTLGILQPKPKVLKEGLAKDFKLEQSSRTSPSFQGLFGGKVLVILAHK